MDRTPADEPVVTPAAMLLRGVDRAAFAVALATRLRAGGVPVGSTAVEDLVRALALAVPRWKAELYWTARICLVRRHTDLARFDAVFAAVFDDAVLQLDPHARRSSLPGASPETVHVPVPGSGSEEQQEGAGLPWATLPPAVEEAADSLSPLVVRERLPSAVAGLADLPFEDLSPAQMRLLGGWLEASLRTWPTRRSRRFATDSAGHRIALRPTVARSRRTGWEPIELVHARAVRKARRVVMLCDVSQSMRPQAVAYFHLMRALARQADAEVFAFATTLTRLTPVLAHRDPDLAITLATERVTDRFGGTRIATNLQALLSSHHGGTLRGAVVIIGSDGWDSDPPEQLAAAMARLRRRAHRVIWMNPRAAAPGFAPLVSAMSAARPYCDELLPAASFGSLAAVVAAVREPVRSTGSRGSRAGTGRR